MRSLGKVSQADVGCRIQTQLCKTVRQMHETPRMLPPYSCSSTRGEQEEAEEAQESEG